MTTTYVNSMFDSIKDALTKNEKPTSRLKDQLKLEVDNTYIVRLLPNVNNPAETFLHYYNFSWKSLATGQQIVLTSPTSWGERDPIAEERFRVYRSGTAEEKEAIKQVRRGENWMVNVYVVSDPVNPENNNKIKVLRFGKQLHKVIMDAIEGEDSAEFGPRVFDLSSAGCNLKIKCEKQGDYPTYVASKFQSPKEIEGLPASEHDTIYKSIFDLNSFITVKSYEELQTAFEQHYLLKKLPANATVPATAATATAATAITAPQKAATTTTTATTDDEVADLLKGL